MPTLLDVQDLTKTFSLHRAQRFPWERAELVHAVRGVTLTVQSGEVVGLVGESGSGKTTIGRCITRLERPTTGGILFQGTSVGFASGESLRQIRRNIQMVFQDSYSSLDPRQQVDDILEEPLRLLTNLGDDERKRLVDEIRAKVELPSDLGSRYRHQLSGGQQQRVNLARALVTHPRLIVLDEPVSSLDASLRGHVIRLLKEVQAAFGLSYLFISHDLTTVRELCNRVAIVFGGRIVEMGSVHEIFESPLHPYTRMLIASRLVVGDLSRDERRNEWSKVGRDWIDDEQWGWMDERGPSLAETSPAHFLAIRQGTGGREQRT